LLQGPPATDDEKTMTKQNTKHIAILSGVLSLGLLATSCETVKEMIGMEPKEPEPKSCVANLDTAGDVKVDGQGDLPIKVKAVLEGTVHLREAIEKLDKDVAHACAAVGRDLSKDAIEVDEGKPAGVRALSVCSAAAKRVKSSREDNGVVLLVYPQAPICTTSLSEHTSCLRGCDPNLPADGVQCDPDSASGRCGEKCEGVCVTSHSEECAGSCRGACRGGCDEDFFGKCGGRCNGTCDGNSVSGKCEGVCEGKCSKDADGSCGGTCKGKCAGFCLTQSEKKECSGTCQGSCSEDMELVRCGAVLAPPEMVPECAAMCNAKMTREVHCLAGNVDIQVYNSTKEGAGAKLQGALKKGIDVLSQADDGMRQQFDRATERLTTAFDTVEEAIANEQKVKQDVGGCLESAKEEFEDTKAALEKIREASQAVFLAAKG
jgi:hypothetical protein